MTKRIEKVMLLSKKSIAFKIKDNLIEQTILKTKDLMIQDKPEIRRSKVIKMVPNHFLKSTLKIPTSEFKDI